MERTVQTKFYTYDQNNSGGYYMQHLEKGIGKNIVIEATSPQEANQKLNKIVENHRDYCSCCGERWYAGSDEGDGHSEPLKYGKPIREYVNEEIERGGFGFNNNAAIHYFDGKIEWVGLAPSKND